MVANWWLLRLGSLWSGNVALVVNLVIICGQVQVQEAINDK